MKKYDDLFKSSFTDWLLLFLCLSIAYELVPNMPVKDAFLGVAKAGALLVLLPVSIGRLVLRRHLHIRLSRK